MTQTCCLQQQWDRFAMLVATLQSHAAQPKTFGLGSLRRGGRSYLLAIGQLRRGTWVTTGSIAPIQQDLPIMPLIRREQFTWVRLYITQ